MSAHGNPNIVSDGLVLCLDVADRKSLLAPPTTNLANNSNGTINWTIANLGTGGATQSTVNANDYHYRFVLNKGTNSYIAFRFAFDHTNLTDGETYIISYKYKIISGSGTFQVSDFCDRSVTRVTEDIGDGWYYETAYGVSSSYTETYDFFDVRASDNMTIDIKEIQVEHTSASSPLATPFVSYQRQWKDRSGNSNNGTFTNGPTFDSSNSGSIVFDGVNDYTSFSATKTAECTFAVWAKSNETSTGALSDMLFNAGSSGRGPDLYFNSSKIIWNTWDGANNPFCTMPSLVVDGNFHYYAVVCDASAEEATLYIDGEEYGTANHTTALQQARLTENTNLYVGGNSGDFIWNGNIAAFKMYNRAFTAAEVLQNYNATKSRFEL